LNMAKLCKKILKSAGIGVIAVLLVAIGIDAADNHDHLSDSILGRLIAPKNPPCPSDMVFVTSERGGFCMDKFEAAPGKSCRHPRVDSQEKTRNNLQDADCQPVSEKDREPWRFLSQSQAILACAKAGKRLPTPEEWYQASLGTPDKPGSAKGCQLSSNWTRQPGLTGSGDRCRSSFGVYDMVGNVWEWVKAEAHNGELDGQDLPPGGYVTAVDTSGLPTATRQTDPDPNFNHDRFWHKDQGVRSLARGGYWDSGQEGGMYAAYLNAPPSFAGTGIGFRCVKGADKR